MQILKWLLVNWDSVLLVALVVALIIYLIKTGQTKIFKENCGKIGNGRRGRVRGRHRHY